MQDEKKLYRSYMTGFITGLEKTNTKDLSYEEVIAFGLGVYDRESDQQPLTLFDFLESFDLYTSEEAAEEKN